MQVVLTIAGSDSSAGAGIQQDLKVITALGHYAATVITAITAQNTQGVQGVQPAEAEMVARQIRSVMDDLDVRAIKIGMIPNLAVAQAIVSELSNLSTQSMPPIVWDPVMISTSGTRLMAEDCIGYLQEHLAPHCTLITPNLPESELFPPPYCTHMLIKGGHAEGEAMTDRLFMLDGSIHTFTQARIHTRNLHGTGCTLSSAIASFLAQGLSLPEAVAQGKEFLTQAIRNALNASIGQGNGPLICSAAQ